MAKKEAAKKAPKAKRALKKKQMKELRGGKKKDFASTLLTPPTTEG